jgi:1,5-anhydro-D-fructose reductase (1,5-anhydro-D-mannitol-forming)
MSNQIQPVRFAILGFGLHAGRRIVPAFAPAQHAVLAGLWRRDQAAAAGACRTHNIAHNFPTREALCASPEIDAVFIASPDAMHCEDTLLALAHGKPVLCEKPVSMDAAEAVRMAEAAAANNVLYGVAQNFRFNRSVRLIRDWIAEGRIGQPQFAHAQFCYPAQNSPRKWIADSNIAAGGPIADVGVHCIDTLRYILAADVRSVSTIATDIEPPASDTMVPIDPGAPPLPKRTATNPGAPS